MVERGDRSFPDRDAALGFLRRQTWVDPDGQKDRRLQALLDERLVARPDGTFVLRDVPDLAVGVVTVGAALGVGKSAATCFGSALDHDSMRSGPPIPNTWKAT